MAGLPMRDGTTHSHRRATRRWDRELSAWQPVCVPQAGGGVALHRGHGMLPMTWCFLRAASSCTRGAGDRGHPLNSVLIFHRWWEIVSRKLSASDYRGLYYYESKAPLAQITTAAAFMNLPYRCSGSLAEGGKSCVRDHFVASLYSFNAILSRGVRDEHDSFF